jgi:hypothetical protein
MKSLVVFYFGFAALCVSASLRETSVCSLSGSRQGAKAQKKNRKVRHYQILK